MAKRWAEGQRKRSTHHGTRILPLPMSRTLLAIVADRWFSESGAGLVARLSEEPCAGQPHAGICEGGAREGVSLPQSALTERSDDSGRTLKISLLSEFIRDWVLVNGIGVLILETFQYLVGLISFTDDESASLKIHRGRHSIGNSQCPLIQSSCLGPFLSISGCYSPPKRHPPRSLRADK